MYNINCWISFSDGFRTRVTFERLSLGECRGAGVPPCEGDGRHRGWGAGPSRSRSQRWFSSSGLGELAGCPTDTHTRAHEAVTRGRPRSSVATAESTAYGTRFTFKRASLAVFRYCSQPRSCLNSSGLIELAGLSHGHTDTRTRP